jgi:ribosomal protein S8
MVICNDIANLFFVIVNNISYNKLEVEKKVLKKIKKVLKKEGFLKKYIVYSIILNSD